MTHRQRPETASGVVFLTLEDDTGAVNVIVWPDHLERYRSAVLGGNLLTVYGTWQRDTDTGGQVMNLLAQADRRSQPPARRPRYPQPGF